jgi:hypothetical protein
LVFLVVSFLPAFPPMSYTHSSFTHSCYMPSHFILLDLSFQIILGEEYKLWTCSLYRFLQPPVTSTLFGPDILLSTLFSNTLSLCSSLNVRHQVSHPYRTTGKTIILNILIFMLLDNRQEDKRHLLVNINMNRQCLCFRHMSRTADSWLLIIAYHDDIHDVHVAHQNTDCPDERYPK